MTQVRETRDWTAKDELFELKGQHHDLVVSGQVQTLKTSEHASLHKAEPQGINPRILILDLKVHSSGIGGDIVQWKEVTFKEKVARHQFDEVDIKGDIAKPVTVKVHEFTA